MYKLLATIIVILLAVIGLKIFSPNEHSIEKVTGSQSNPEEYITPELKENEVIPSEKENKEQTTEIEEVYTNPREEIQPEVIFTNVNNSNIKKMIIAKSLIDNKCFSFEEKEVSLVIKINGKCNFIVGKENQIFELNRTYNVINIENKIMDIEDLNIKPIAGVLYMIKRDWKKIFNLYIIITNLLFLHVT